MSSQIYESCIISSPLEKVWELIRPLDFKFVETVASSEMDAKGQESNVGSTRKITYKDKTVQVVKILEISESNTSLSYELIQSDPAVNYLGVFHTIRCRRVTEKNSTFVEFTSIFSKDASNEVIMDSKYKKFDFFTGLRNILLPKKRKNWLPLESNPTLMNKYIRQLGAESEFEFCDVYGIEEDLLAMVSQPVRAVLLLFPISDASEAHRKEEEKKLSKECPKLSSNVYFTKQTVGNACGTVGILHAILNNCDVMHFREGKFFEKFLAETKQMNPEQRAEALERNKDIEVQHEAVATEAKSNVNHPINADLHFNCFVCVDNTLYELDGRKARPINHGPSSPSTLLKDAVKVIRQFIDRDPKGMLFSMVALAPPSNF